MQTDTRIAFEGLVLGLYKVGVLPRESVRTVLHTMENHAHESRSLSSAIDIEMLLMSVMEQLPRGRWRDEDHGDEFDDDDRVLMNA